MVNHSIAVNLWWCAIAVISILLPAAWSNKMFSLHHIDWCSCQGIANWLNGHSPQSPSHWAYLNIDSGPIPSHFMAADIPNITLDPCALLCSQYKIKWQWGSQPFLHTHLHCHSSLWWYLPLNLTVYDAAFFICAMHPPLSIPHCERLSLQFKPLLPPMCLSYVLLHQAIAD